MLEPSFFSLITVDDFISFFFFSFLQGTINHEDSLVHSKTRFSCPWTNNIGFDGKKEFTLEKHLAKGGSHTTVFSLTAQYVVFLWF